MRSNSSKSGIFKAAALMSLVLSIVPYAQGSPGDLDPSFGSGGTVFISGNTVPRRVVIQPDGKIMTFGDYPYTSYAFLARNNSNGTPDSLFSGGLVFLRQFEEENLYFVDFVTLPDGKYLVTGFKDGSSALFRYNSNGSPDTSFGTNGVLTGSFYGGEAIVLQPDGRVITGGHYVIDDVSKYLLIRYNVDGTLDAGFGGNGMILADVGADKVVLQPDGKILVRSQTNRITRYNSNGTRDLNFGTNGVVYPGISYVGGIDFQSNGKIIFGGTGSQNRSRLERYNDNGTLDTAFGTNGGVDLTDTSNLGVVRSLVVQRNNKIVTAGSVNGIFAVYRFDSNGSLDATFGTNGLVTTQMSPICRLFDITLQPDGKILAVGDVSNPYGVGLVRYLGDPVSAVVNVTVSGRVLTPGGNGLRNAVVTLTDLQGNARTATTSSLGYYSIDNIAAGSSYTAAVSSRRYRFNPLNMQINTSLANVDFVGLE